jgi:5'-nucleotidase
MKILITNDDSVYAKGLEVLTDILSTGNEVTVCAPLKQQSACGHGITVFDPIRTYQLKDNTYAVDGTPADCIRIALEVFLKKQKPDIVISGINPGINVGDNILYSGTVATALEAYIFNIPSMAVSIDGFEKLDYKHAAEFALKTAKQIEQSKFELAALNINIPNIAAKKIKGVKITHQGRGSFNQVYHKRTDPRKNRYFWPDGKMAGADKNKLSDYYAVKKGYISVTPLHHNLTNEHFIKQTQKLFADIL